jgi:hypothetical protein
MPAPTVGAAPGLRGKSAQSSHTIMLIQYNRSAPSRTYRDFDSLDLALDGELRPANAPRTRPPLAQLCLVCV